MQLTPNQAIFVIRLEVDIRLNNNIWTIVILSKRRGHATAQSHCKPALHPEHFIGIDGYLIAADSLHI